MKKEWKTDKWIILGCFTLNANPILENYGILDINCQYYDGTIQEDSLLHVLNEILTIESSDMERVYDAGSGYGMNGRITNEGLIVLWLNGLDVSVFEPNSSPYCETPLFIYLITHSLSVIESTEPFTMFIVYAILLHSWMFPAISIFLRFIVTAM